MSWKNGGAGGPSEPLQPNLKILLRGLAMGESPRWHDGRLWFSDWGAQEIIATGVFIRL
jgi:hypothetical protein